MITYLVGDRQNVFADEEEEELETLILSSTGAEGIIGVSVRSA